MLVQEQLRSALQNGTIEDCLHLISVKPGDCVFVPAGTVHALGPGIVLAEVQQQSNLTFSTLRLGPSRRERQASRRSMSKSPSGVPILEGPVDPVKPVQLCDADHGFEELVRCEYFVIRRHRFLDPIRLNSDNRFRILMCLDGDGTILTETGAATYKKGTTVLLPAGSGSTRINPGRSSYC